MDLIDFLCAKRDSLNMGDAEFARFLGVTDLSLWTRLRDRVRHPNLKLMQIAAERFPKEQVAIFEAAKASSVRPSSHGNRRKKVAAPA